MRNMEVPVLVLANAIGLVHILVQIWLAAGILLVIIIPRLRMAYWVTLVLTVVSRLVYGGCPLTIWQEAIKHRPDVEPYLSEVFTIEVARSWFTLSPPSTMGLLVVAMGLASLLLRDSWRKTSGRTP